MDKLTRYPKLLKQILEKQIALCNRLPNRAVETYLIADDTRGDYLWMNVGWQHHERVCGTTVYVRLRNGKFFVEEDWTEDGIATELLQAGVPNEDIVLAFHEPQIRHYTEFAAA